MFTGLIVEVGSIAYVGARPGGLQLAVRAPRIVADAAVGDSIACNGVCLTIESMAGEQFEAHAGWRPCSGPPCTWRPGDPVNSARPAPDRPHGATTSRAMSTASACTGRPTAIHGSTASESEDRMVYGGERHRYRRYQSHRYRNRRRLFRRDHLACRQHESTERHPVAKSISRSTSRRKCPPDLRGRHTARDRRHGGPSAPSRLHGLRKSAVYCFAHGGMLRVHRPEHPWREGYGHRNTKGA